MILAIVIPSIKWKGFESGHFPEYLLTSIYKYLQEEKDSKIQKITIALEKSDEFFNYATKLRKISDLYLRNGFGFVY